MDMYHELPKVTIPQKQWPSKSTVKNVLPLVNVASLWNVASLSHDYSPSPKIVRPRFKLIFYFNFQSIVRLKLCIVTWFSALSALRRFPASNRSSKESSEMYRFWVWSRHCCFILTWNRHAAKGSLLVEKQNDFSIQKCVDLQLGKSLSGDGWCYTKCRVSELHGCQTEIISLFILLRVDLLVAEK